MDNWSNGNFETNFGRTKILDVIPQIIADRCRKIGFFAEKIERLPIEIIEEPQKFGGTQKSWSILSRKKNGKSWHFYCKPRKMR